MALSNHTLDTAAYNTNSIQGFGAYPNASPAPVFNGNYPLPPETWQPNIYGFKVCKVENGWTIAIDGKQWICATPQELGERMVAILVQERLDK